MLIQLGKLLSSAAFLQCASPPCTTRASLPTHNGHPPQVRLHDALAFRITPLHPLPSHSEWRPWLGQPMYERHEEDEGPWARRRRRTEAGQPQLLALLSGSPYANRSTNLCRPLIAVYTNMLRAARVGACVPCPGYEECSGAAAGTARCRERSDPLGYLLTTSSLL